MTKNGCMLYADDFFSFLLSTWRNMKQTWLYFLLFFICNKELMDAVRPRSKVFAPLGQVELDDAKAERLKELKVWSVLRELFVYFMYIWVLYVISIGNMSYNSYLYPLQLSNLFTQKNITKSSVIKFGTVSVLTQYFFFVCC
jgi:hypothetical protein